MEANKQQTRLDSTEDTGVYVVKNLVSNEEVTKLKNNAVSVYKVLKIDALYDSEIQGTATLGLDAIEYKTGLSREQVSKSLAELEEAGYIAKA
ncbi:MAG: hypothetical protein PHT15_07395 [Gallionellaceae bacterium]|nr:hypothetical protein [Gallionellaceae bacterium]